MAQIITCDGHNGEHPADWLLTRLVDGEVQAYCDSAFLEFVTMAASAAASNEADGADQAAIDRLEAAGDVALGDVSEVELGPGEDARVLPDGTVVQVETAHTVRKGQSAKARAHREKVAAAAPIQGEPGVHDQGPDDDEDDDEAEADQDDAPTP